MICNECRSDNGTDLKIKGYCDTCAWPLFPPIKKIFIYIANDVSIYTINKKGVEKISIKDHHTVIIKFVKGELTYKGFYFDYV